MRRPALLLLAALLLVGCADHSADWQVADQLEAQQRKLAVAERAQRAAQAMCASDHGPQVVAVWTDDTTVACLNPRGHRVDSFSQESSYAAR